MKTKIKIPKEVYIVMVGVNVKQLQKKATFITFLNPVARKRAKTMRTKFLYNPVIKDEFTLKSDPNFKK